VGREENFLVEKKAQVSRDDDNRGRYN
jgi:hypothetical protein